MVDSIALMKSYETEIRSLVMYPGIQGSGMGPGHGSGNSVQVYLRLDLCNEVQGESFGDILDIFTGLSFK